MSGLIQPTLADVVENLKLAFLKQSKYQGNELEWEKLPKHEPFAYFEYNLYRYLCYVYKQKPLPEMTSRKMAMLLSNIYLLAFLILNIDSAQIHHPKKIRENKFFNQNCGYSGINLLPSTILYLFSEIEHGICLSIRDFYKFVFKQDNILLYEISFIISSIADYLNYFYFHQPGIIEIQKIDYLTKDDLINGQWKQHEIAKILNIMSNNAINLKQNAINLSTILEHLNHKIIEKKAS